MLADVLACGVCGSDVQWFGEDPTTPRVLGHQIVVRTPFDTSNAALDLLGLDAGAVYVLEEYLPCRSCKYCARGDWRFCPAVDPSSGGERYGLKPLSASPGLWGGYADKILLTRSTVFARAEDSIRPERLSFALPLANGIEWSRPLSGNELDGLCVIGLGQQGVASCMAGLWWGYDRVRVVADPSDGARTELASELGAEVSIDGAEPDGSEEEFRVVVVTAPSNPKTVALALRLVARGGSVRFAGPGFEPLIATGTLTSKGVEARALRGHSSEAVRTAVDLLAGAQGEILDPHIQTFVGLDEVGSALESVELQRRNGYAHTVVVPTEYDSEEWDGTD